MKLSRARKIASKGVARLDEAARILTYHGAVNQVDRMIAAENAMLARARGYDLATRIGIATRREAAGVPIVQYDKAIGAGKQRRKSRNSGAQ